MKNLTMGDYQMKLSPNGAATFILTLNGLPSELMDRLRMNADTIPMEITKAIFQHIQAEIVQSGSDGGHWGSSSIDNKRMN